MAIIQSLKDNWEYYSSQIKIFIFGENNSRLDKIINRFYGMRPEKRKRIALFSGVMSILVFLLVIGYYFYSITKLQQELNVATDSYVKIEEFKPAFVSVQSEYEKISSELIGKNNITSLINQIKAEATRFNVQITSFSAESPQVIDLSQSSVLKSEMKKARIDFQINSISLKHLTNFLNELHQSPHKFILTKLDIQQTESKKLYFNSKITVEAYIPVNSVSPNSTSSKG